MGVKMMGKKEKTTFSEQNILEERDLRHVIFIEEHREVIIEFSNLPDDVEFIIPNESQRPNLYREGWVTLYEYPFTLGFKLPFTKLVQDFLKTQRFSISQLMSMCWKGFAVLEVVGKKLGISFTVNDVELVWARRISSNTKVTFRTEGFASSILKLNNTTERGWQGKYVFIKVKSLGLKYCSLLISEWRTEGTLLS